MIDWIPAACFLLFLIILYIALPKVFFIAALGVFFALLLKPLVVKIQQEWHLSGTKSTAIVYGLLGILLVGLLALTLPAIFKSLSHIQEQLVQVESGIAQLAGPWYHRLNGQEFFQYVQNRVYAITQGLGTLFLKTAETFLLVLASFVLSFYFIRDRQTIGLFLLSLFPFSRREKIRLAAGRAQIVWERFVGGQLFVAFIIGTLETILLLFAGIPYPFLFGIIGGLSNLIPYVGPFLGAVPPVITVLYQGGNLYRLIYTVLIFVLVQQLDNWFLTPKIMKGRIGLHPVVTIFAVLIGAELLGLWGAVLAVPVTGMILSIFNPITRRIQKDETGDD
ncbi:MAG: AI-2E family transporter [Clostridia bacterium]|nr:AI-2E family transporter [Clostridia bacterium]